jgi:Rho termination factor-like protein
MATTAVEKPKTRSDLAQLAGRGPFSLIAMLAGVLVGYATFALLLGGAVAILRGNESQLDLSENWGDLSSRGGLLLGGLLFLAYLLAGYIAGRMAWRRGAAHGVLVFLGSILVIGVAAVLLRTLTQPDDVKGITEALQRFGVPTTREEWGNLGAVTWVATLGGMLLGSVLGGLLGERWFTKVSRRALDAEIDLRERMEASNERLAPVGGAEGDGNGHRARTGNGARKAASEADVIDVDEMNKEELYQLAQEQDIPGRSHMSKDELATALKKQGALQKH